MRILFITSSYPRFEGDGTAPFVKSIAESMVLAGNVVHVIAPYDPMVNNFNTNGVELHRFKYIWPLSLHIMGHGNSLQGDIKLKPLVFFILPFFLIAEFVQGFLACQKLKPQMIYAHWVIPNGLVAAVLSFLLRIPLAISLHGSDIFIARQNKGYGFIARRVFKQASLVTACSPDLREQALILGAPKTTKLLPWGADPNIFNPAKFDRKTIRDQYGWNNNEIIVGSLGRLVYKKGFNVLIDAFSKIVNNQSNVRLVIGGEGPIKEELIHQAKELGVYEKITFLGRVPWNLVPCFLTGIDIFILPSIKDQSGNIDGLPTVLLEAMSCGKPIIASGIGGIPLVIEERENGLLVEPGNAQALFECIEMLVTSERIRYEMGALARQSVINHYNWKQITEEITNLMQEITVK